MSSNIVYKSKYAEESMNHAKAILRELLQGVPNYSSIGVDAAVELIFSAAVMESNANLRYVLQK